MEVFSFDNKWDSRNISLFVSLLILPNLLGAINLSTPWGWKFHFFQVAVFLAAVKFGPVGGAASGFLGSFYSALVMGNPYIVVMNTILGFFVGLFVRYNLHTVLAVMLAFVVEIPFLVVFDLYFMSLPVAFVSSLLFALAFSNLIWALIVHKVKDVVA